MKLLVAAFLMIVLALSACKEISYKEPQPKGKRSLRSIPKKLQGRYLLTGEEENATDTLVVTDSSYRIVSDNEGKEVGDSLVIKKYKGYYFVNINDNPEWLLRIIKKEKNGDLLYMSMQLKGKSFKELIAALAVELRVDSLKIGDEELYQIDPTPKQLMKLVHGGFFSDTLRMKRIR